MLLCAAATLEIVWAIALERSAGFTHFWPAVIGVTAAILSFVLLTFALKTLPVGTAYAVWVGLGALGVAAAGILALGESAAPARLGCLALILGGVVGLRLLDG
ncbi:multidrug efflux SMR transporter [Microtetraspora sp. NBRC 13810]|uniref:DMT family transporter n=1 Tax=Microtetraspora sp. NBRC 13810 TaxID=3030990 RepID=UPI003319C2F2